MEILEKQYLLVESLLSYKARTTCRNLNAMILHIDESLPLLGLRKKGSALLTMTQHRYNCDEPILDVEIMFPIDGVFKSNEHFVYKPKIVLTNALKKRCAFNISDMLETSEKMQEYIYRKQLMPLTDFFYKIIENECGGAVDVYIGINENIV